MFERYILQPVPKWLNNLFDTSHILKFIILFIAGSIAVYPVNKDKLLQVAIGSILTLVLFQSSRYIDTYLEQPNNKEKIQ
jgi:hypothetical protein